MLFLGDIACPSAEHAKLLSEIFSKYKNIFGGKSIIANLEGLVSDNQDTISSTPILFNHSSTIEVLGNNNCIAVGLANNHTLDIPQNFEKTIAHLNRKDIKYCGAGNSKFAAEKPAIIKTHNKTLVLFNACWHFLLYHQKNPSKGIFVSEIEEQNLIRKIEEQKKKHSDDIIAVFLHWSFDLERLPFPMHRTFARALIDAGANFVIGCHSHCVQGGEKYKNGYIVYGLGNFFIPNRIYANGRLKFPEFSKDELVFEYDPINEKAKCHWFKYDDDDGNNLIYQSTEVFEESEKLTAYSPFQNMSDNDYKAFYKKNRRKKFLIPVFVDHRKRIINCIYTTLLKVRARSARFLAKSGFIKWQR